MVGPFNYEELTEDWNALNNFTETMYPIELMSRYYEILFMRYIDEIAKSDLVSQKEMFDPFFKLKEWGSYFTEKLIPEFLRYDDNIRWTLKLVGGLKEEYKSNISNELIKSLRAFDMPAQ